VVALDDRYYQLYDEMVKRFPGGPPSLRFCDSLRVTGDVRFGKDVRVAGVVEVNNPDAEPLYVPDGALLRA
jgi:UTP--glucose-1-phosphate uridylyltransferase